VSIALSSLGILAPARHAFVTWSLSAPLELVLAAYNATMQLLFGWAHPYLQAALTWLGSWIGWRPTLYPHWKDVFLVISLIGISAGRAVGRVAALERAAVTFILCQILGAAITALAAGVLPLQSPDLITQLLIAASLGLAVLPFLVVSSVVESDISALYTTPIVAAALSALAALPTWGLSLTLGTAVGIGLVGLTSVVVLIGLFFLGVGRSQRVADAHIFVRWGISILGGFVGAAFLAAADAGLKLLGA
jgi:hypothetical protein